MVTTMRKKPHSAEFKFKVALAALKGDKTIAELSHEFGVVGSQIHKWKKEFLEHGATVFKGNTASKGQVDQNEIDKLHATIGRLKVENDFLERFVRGNR